MKGQLDIQFQWIYVLIAGGTFLFLFFFAFKACTNNNDQQEESASVRTAATIISGAVWQPESARNVTLNAQANCVAGTLTLTSGDSRAQIQRTAAFMPPVLSGKSTLVVVPVTHEADRVPAIKYGNILYVRDENTHYYTLDESIPGSIMTTQAEFEDIDVPGNAKTLVLITKSSADLENTPVPRTNAAIYGVAARADGSVDFYKRDGARLRKTQSATHDGKELMLGAMIAATPENYLCAKANFVQRARDIAKIYVARSSMLLSDGMPQACIDQHSLARNILGAQMDDDRFIAALRDGRLLSGQRTLHELGCAVIA